MIEKQYTNVNPCKLQDELITAGLIAGSFLTFDLGNNIAQIQFNDDVDLTLVDSIVAKHNPIPIPPLKTDIQNAQDNINSLGGQLVQSKISNMQKDNLIKSLGTQLTQSKIQDLQDKTINNNLGKQLVQSKIQIIKLKGGK